MPIVKNLDEARRLPVRVEEQLACRLLVKVLVRVAGVKELSVPVPVPRRSAPTVVPHTEVKHEVLSPKVYVCITKTEKSRKRGPKW